MRKDVFQKIFNESYDINTELDEEFNKVLLNTKNVEDLQKYCESKGITKINQEDVVVDFPTNSIINKKGYYSIKHINEDEILQRISRKQMLEDFKKYDDTFNDIGISVPFYLTCRDEIIKDLEKNDKITRKK